MTDDELAAVEQAVVENTGGPVPRATVLDLIARVRAAESACAGSEEHCDQLIEDRDRWKARAEQAEAALEHAREVIDDPKMPPGMRWRLYDAIDGPLVIRNPE